MVVVVVCVGGVHVVVIRVWFAGGRSRGLPTSHWVHMQEVDDDFTQI